MQHAAYRNTPAVAPSAPRFSPRSSGGLAVRLRQAPTALFGTLAAWQRQAEERAHLARLSDHQLQDLGLTRGAVEEMARKPFWSR